MSEAPSTQAASVRVSRPRIWPAVVVGCAAPLVAVVVAGIVIAAAMLLDVGAAGMQDSSAAMGWVLEFGSTPMGLVVLVLPTQLVLLGVALGAAGLSRETFRERLAIRRGRFALWTYPILVMATLAMGMIGGALAPAGGERGSEQLTMIYTAMAGAAGLQAALLLIVISLVPGVVEEVLFRGYVQSRLLRRWPSPPLALVAIGFSTFVFTIAHFDVAHSLAVLPIGAWLGVVAWRAGSIVPAIVCHACNNAVGFLTAGLAGPETIDSVLELPSWVWAIGAASLVAGVVVVVRWGATDQRNEVGTLE